MMRFIGKLIATMVLSVVLVVPVLATDYISLNGKFKFTYPDDWEQMDYNTVDAFLYNNRASRESFKYEAVFSPKSNSPFYNGDYLIVTLDLIGPLDSVQTDSAMHALGMVFGNRVKYFPQSNYIANLQSNTPYFDRANRVAKVLNDLSEADDPFKTNLLIMKFYEQGIARFYFYSPDSLFEASRPMFEQMVASFTTDHVDESLPKEEVKIANIEVEKDSGSKKSSWFIISSAVVVILIVILARRRKKRAAKSD